MAAFAAAASGASCAGPACCGCGDAAEPSEFIFAISCEEQVGTPWSC